MSKFVLNIFIQICYLYRRKVYEKLSYCNSILVYCDDYNYSVCTTSPYIFESDNVLGEGEIFVVNNNDKTMMYSQQTIEEEVETKECKSPCPSSAEMCIEICA